MQAHPWGTLAPQGCQWHSTEDHHIQITLTKAPNSLGSWPYSFRSLVLHLNSTATTTTDNEINTKIKRAQQQILCNHDKKAFNKHSDALLASHIAESRAIKAAFAHAIAEQMSTLPSGPLGQSAFLFPQQGPHCLAFLKECYYNDNIPSVRKLIRIAHNLTGILLIEEEQVGSKEENNEEKDLPPPSSLSFYSLRNLVCCIIAGLAAVEQYRYTHGLDAIKSITSCTGFGAGEYAAAVFAGALRLDDALVAIKTQARVFEEEKYQLRNDIEDCRSRAIDAVHAKLTEEKGMTAKVRSPRLRMYSGADGVVYEESSTAILNALPFGVCAEYAAVSHRHDVRVALMQQGVAEMTVLVPEKGDSTDDEEVEVVVEVED